MSRAEIIKLILKPSFSLPLFRLIYKVSGHVWSQSEEHLFDFNKSIITLSSSALVLSFSLIKISNVSINKSMIGWSWTLLTVTISLGVLLLFLKFITRFSDRIIEKRADNKEYTIPELLNHEEVLVYFSGIALMFIISFLELGSFLVGLIILMIAAFNTL